MKCTMLPSLLLVVVASVSEPKDVIVNKKDQ
jgi:hypothetical protein